MIDYDETFSPVVKFQSIPVLLAFALQNDLLLHQNVVVTAFLNDIENMLKKYQHEDVKPVSTPANPNVTLQKNDGVSKALNLVVYQSMIGSLLYAAVGTIPDISHAVGVTS